MSSSKTPLASSSMTSSSAPSADAMCSDTEPGDIISESRPPTLSGLGSPKSRLSETRTSELGQPFQLESRSTTTPLRHTVHHGGAHLGGSYSRSGSMGLTDKSNGVGTLRNSRSPERTPAPLLWPRALAQYVGDTSAEPHPDEIEREVEACLRVWWDDREASQNGAHEQASSSSSSSSSIPSFYRPRAAPDSLAGRTQRLAKLRFLKKQEESLLEQNELEALWLALHEFRTPPHDAHSQDREMEDLVGEQINYDDFKLAAAACAERIGAKCRAFFTAATFLTFEADEAGRILILPLYLYIMRWVSLARTRIDMSMLDNDNDGCLTPLEVEEYIKKLVPTLRGLRGMEPSFASLYARIAARKFFFFADTQKRGKVVIKELLLSPVLSELMELTNEPGEDNQAALQDNWFTLLSARHMFVVLDKDRNGTLSRSELSAFADDNLTDIFIERIFDEQVRRTRGERGQAREMGLGSFLDLVLAFENKYTPEGLAYIFKCLDIQGRGFLTAADVYTLFRSVHKRWIEGGNYELLIEDVKDEVWDMVKPRDPLRITLEDLVECRHGDTVVSMLIDVGGFWAHDNRENLVAQQDAGDN
eukprot:jgi/Mesen1/7212/ME000371S06298